MKRKRLLEEQEPQTPWDAVLENLEEVIYGSRGGWLKRFQEQQEWIEEWKQEIKKKLAEEEKDLPVLSAKPIEFRKPRQFYVTFEDWDGEPHIGIYPVGPSRPASAEALGMLIWLPSPDGDYLAIADDETYRKLNPRPVFTPEWYDPDDDGDEDDSEKVGKWGWY